MKLNEAREIFETMNFSEANEKLREGWVLHKILSKQSDANHIAPTYILIRGAQNE